MLLPLSDGGWCVTPGSGFVTSSRAHSLGVTDVCERHQNMALSFSANGQAACNRLQLPSLPWRERAFKTGKRLRRHRDRAHLFGWQMPPV